MTSQADMTHWWQGIFYSPPRFLMYNLAGVLSIFNIQGMAYLVSITSARNLKVALCLAIAGTMIHSLFSGFFIPASSFNPVMRVFAEWTMTKVGFELIMISIYGMNRCDPKDSKWSMIMYQLDYDRLDAWELIKNTLIQIVAWRILALLALVWLANGWSIDPTSLCSPSAGVRRKMRNNMVQDMEDGIGNEFDERKNMATA
jgi:hypothetical protein